MDYNFDESYINSLLNLEQNPYYTMTDKQAETLKAWRELQQGGELDIMKIKGIKPEDVTSGEEALAYEKAQKLKKVTTKNEMQPEKAVIPEEA